MNTSNPMQIEQKATVQAFQGKGQVVRDGFFLPLQTGMELLAGDRVSALPGGRVEIQFTGVSTALVVANGSSATLFVEMTDPSAGPQWVAGNLYGPEVFFADSSTSPAINPGADLSQPGSSSMMGLFGYDKPSGAFPVMETVAGASALALVAGGYSGTEDEDSTLTTASQAGFPDSPSSQGSGDASGTNSSTSATGSTGNTTDSTAGTGDAANGSADGGGGATSDTPLDSLLGGVNTSPLGSALSSLSSPLGLDTLLGQQTLV